MNNEHSLQKQFQNQRILELLREKKNVGKDFTFNRQKCNQQFLMQTNRIN